MRSSDGGVAPRHDPARGRGTARPAGLARRAVCAAPQVGRDRRARRARQLRAPRLRPRPADAPSAVDPARRPGDRHGRDSLQGRRRGPAGTVAPRARGKDLVPRADRARLRARRGAAAGGPLPLVLLGSELPFPFRPRPSTILVPDIPAGAIAAMPLLEEWGVPSRLATLAGFAGCFPGFVTELAAAWLSSLPAAELARVALYACGPTPMLAAVARLAQRFGLPAQVSLEEFMACAVGGCAGCAVRVVTPTGIAMKRVCVDGPVFDANAVFPPAA